MVADSSGIPAVAGPVAEVLPEMPASSIRPRTSPRTDVRLRHIVEANFDFIWRSLRGLGVPASVADDATQQVFWTASRRLDEIAVGSERAFLFATARGVAANLRRSQSRRREDVDADVLGRQVDDAPSPEQAAASSEARRLLERILDGMPEDLRTAFVLFELEGVTTSGIAELLGIPMGTVASRLRRAREVFDRETSRLQAERGGER